MNVWDYLESLKSRWRLIALVMLLTIVAVAIWTWQSPRTYTASATLLFDLQQADPVAAKGGGGATKSTTVLGTQADIIRSGIVAQRVVANLGYDKQPDLVQRYRESGEQRLGLREWIGRRLIPSLDVETTRTTNVLSVNYKSSDPVQAAQLATAFAEAYVQTQLQLRVDPARVYSQWFQSQINEARDRLEQAQRRLSSFQQQRGLVGAGRFDIEQAQLSELSAQMTNAQAEAAQARARANTSAGTSSSAQQSAVVQGLDTQIASKSAELQQLRQTLGPNHPMVTAAQAEVAELRARRSQAVGTVVSAVRTDSAAASAREANLRGLVAAQRERVLRLASAQDEMSVLQRDVDSARAAYDAVTGRLNDMRLQAEIPQTNVSILDRATAPTLPSSPNVALRLLLGVVSGLFGGVVLALFLEWRNPRVRTAEGFEQATGLPVLADLNRGSVHVGFAGKEASA
ncbi:exopolysaccharide biosynthesis protein [Nostoc sp. 3335mG]|nr:exopolysaccharide biosynthesis protein [Nostoc sp. 3335mG]